MWGAVNCQRILTELHILHRVRIRAIERIHCLQLTGLLIRNYYSILASRRIGISFDNAGLPLSIRLAFKVAVNLIANVFNSVRGGNLGLCLICTL